MRGTCSFCGREVNTKLPGVVVEVRGWAKVREQGGANAIRGREPLGRVAHESCLEVHLRGGEQGALQL